MTDILLGRSLEQLSIKAVLDRARLGEGGALVISGEAGVGKTSLLAYALELATDVRVAQIVGIESEMTFAYAGVDQLVRPYITQFETLPLPQRNALEAVLGLRDSSATGPMLVGLAVLTLLSNMAATAPLLCVVDDAQWLDSESADVVAFVARRVRDDRLALLIAVREPAEQRLPFDGVPVLPVAGLPADDAKALLRTSAGAVMDPRVQERLIFETGGNPLALLELADQLSTDERLGRVGLPVALLLGDRLEHVFLRRVRGLPPKTLQYLLLAAADPTGDRELVDMAAARLEVTWEDVIPAKTLGLLRDTADVAFRHPLMRSAVYGAASLPERRQAHRALAEVTDPTVDPERRAWHRAAAASVPDEAVAAELEACADWAWQRSGCATAAAFLIRAAELSATPCSRAERLVAAAACRAGAGGIEAAEALLLRAAAQGYVDDAHRTQSVVVGHVIKVAQGRWSEAAPLLAAAAVDIEPFDGERALWAHLIALLAYVHVGRNASTEFVWRAAYAARSFARSLPRSTKSTGRLTMIDGAISEQAGRRLLLDGVATRVLDGREQAVPILREALGAIDAEIGGPILLLAAEVAVELWDDAALEAITARQMAVSRRTGGYAVMSLGLALRAEAETLAARFANAESLYAEMEQIACTTGNHELLGDALPGRLMLAALRGDESAARHLANKAEVNAASRRLGIVADGARHGLGVLEIGLGRYTRALEHLQFVWQGSSSSVTTIALPDLVEAAVRSDDGDGAIKAADHLSLTTLSSATPFALGIEARSRALLAAGAVAEECYRTAIDQLSHTRATVHLARAHLLFGEWLRRERRRSEARSQLRTAYEALTSLGAMGFAERARVELAATGERVRSRVVDAAETLTPQERHIAELVAEGASNPDIAGRLYVSRRTVESHLTKMYAKLGVNCRAQLAYKLHPPH
jgi:DNA-binding CsgD family transcriptional regulator